MQSLASQFDTKDIPMTEGLDEMFRIVETLKGRELTFEERMRIYNQWREKNNNAQSPEDSPTVDGDTTEG